MTAEILSAICDGPGCDDGYILTGDSWLQCSRCGGEGRVIIVGKPVSFAPFWRISGRVLAWLMLFALAGGLGYVLGRFLDR
ncbi:MAG: hypothetical protein ACRD4R_06850 [Candidatus Acidiferrales bacterium]